MKIGILNLSVVDLDESLIEKIAGEGVTCIQYSQSPTQLHIPEYVLDDPVQLETCCREYVQLVLNDIALNQRHIDIVVIQAIPEIEDIIGRLFMEGNIQAVFLDVQLRSYELTK